MEQSGKVREPKQKRSIEKKKQIKDTTYRLMCSKGYHSITTNQIAKEAALSIGSLYEYYPNKEAILSDILNDYYDQFINQEKFVTETFIAGMKSEDKHKWIEALLKQQVLQHQNSKAFNDELHSLYYTEPIVAKVCTAQKVMLQQIIQKALIEIKEELKISDLAVASWLFVDFLDTAIDRVLSNPSDLDCNSYLRSVTDMLCNYLFL